MGLDTSHDCWHGPYSSFSRWRNELCKAAGYELEEVKYEGDWFTYTRVVGLNYNIPEERYMGDGWGPLPDCIPAVEGHDPDPMLLLVLHSDCDGRLRYKFTEPVADRLEELLPAIEAADDADGYMASKTRQFIKGLRKAHEERVDVDFH